MNLKKKELGFGYYVYCKQNQSEELWFQLKPYMFKISTTFWVLKSKLQVHQTYKTKELRYQGLNMFWNFPHDFQACKKLH